MRTTYYQVAKNNRKYAFIINPASGSGDAIKCKDLIEGHLGQSEEFQILITRGPGDAEIFSKNAVDKGYTVVVAVGGDGTVNEVARSLIGTEVALAILPVGSGNGLARHLKISMDWNKALDTILKSKEKLIDTAKMNEHRFISVAGIGFDAQVSKEFALSKRRGFINYLRITLKLANDISQFDATLQYDGLEIKKNITAITVANSSQYGNNARIAPKADISDGKLDVCTIQDLSIPRAIRFLVQLITGRLKENKVYQTFRTDQLSVKCDQNWAHVDGDPVKIDGLVNFAVIPQSLSVIC
ncbi:MAG: diacylglycerol kinase family lipid kinase [Vicingaceae bacterium]